MTDYFFSEPYVMVFTEEELCISIGKCFKYLIQMLRKFRKFFEDVNERDLSSSGILRIVE
jgi:hypothetical protein